MPHFNLKGVKNIWHLEKKFRMKSLHGIIFVFQEGCAILPAKMGNSIYFQSTFSCFHKPTIDFAYKMLLVQYHTKIPLLTWCFHDAYQGSYQSNWQILPQTFKPFPVPLIHPNPFFFFWRLCSQLYSQLMECAYHLSQCGPNWHFSLTDL